MTDRNIGLLPVIKKDAFENVCYLWWGIWDDVRTKIINHKGCIYIPKLPIAA